MSKAIWVEAVGGPDVLQWSDHEVGRPGPGQLMIRQHAAGLNYIDVYHRTGLYPQSLPFVPGVEGAGEIIAIGDGVAGFSIGDRIAYAGPIGGYAEERLIDADKVVRLPDSIDFDQAAAMMLQGMTAQMLLRSVYPVAAGDTILVHAAAGGVGLILCQWAKALGATVIGTVGSKAKAALAAAHGCDHPIIYTKQDFVAEVARITGGSKLSVVYDSVGRDTFLKSLDCLRPRGLMVSFGQASGPIEPLNLGVLAQKGSLFVTRPTLFTYIATNSELQARADELFDIVASGKVKIEVKQRFALRQASEAHRALENRETSGSTILTI